MKQRIAMQVLPQHKFHHFGCYLAEMEVDPIYCEKLLNLGKTLTKSHAKNLAGQLQHQYIYPLETTPWLFDELKIYVNTWINGWQQFANKPYFNPEYELNEIWINIMKAKEYNPVHIHTYCDLSFVLWLEVPQEMLDEANKLETNSANRGETGFVYGEDKPLYIVEKHFPPKKNTMMMFPADLRHYVMHFNSDVTRISVSGNIKFL
jgi:uncharacterized protein (TIGR02466 family)